MSEETAEYRVENKSNIETLIKQDPILKRELGLEFLESVILDVLREAKHNGGPPLNAGEISRRARIPFEHETGPGAPYYELTRGLLLLLEYKLDVERPDGRGWQITPFDLDDPEIYNQVKADYDLVREVISTQGFSALTGKMGVYIQPRTKGPRESTSRAFYARTSFLKKILLPQLRT